MKCEYETGKGAELKNRLKSKQVERQERMIEKQRDDGIDLTVYNFEVNIKVLGFKNCE